MELNGNMYFSKYEFLTAALMKILVFWDIISDVSAESSVSVFSVMRNPGLGDVDTEVFRA